jgi:hypothetical protein
MRTRQNEESRPASSISEEPQASPGHRNNHDHACLGDRSHPNPPTAHRQILRAQLGYTRQPEPPTLHSHLQPPSSKNPKSSSERHATPNIMGSNREPQLETELQTPLPARSSLALLPRAPPSRSFPRPSLARSTHALLPRAAPSRSSLVLISRPQLAPYALTCPNTNPKRNIQHHASTSPSSLTQGICTPPPPSLPLDRTRTSALYLHLSFLQPDPKHLHPTSAFPSSTLTYGNCATHPPSLPPA